MKQISDYERICRVTQLVQTILNEDITIHVDKGLE